MNSGLFKILPTNYSVINFYIYIYIYIVIHRQTVSLTKQSVSGWQYIRSPTGVEHSGKGIKGCHSHNIYIYIYIYIYINEEHTVSFQTFFVLALLLIVHTWNSSPLRSNLLRLQCTCCSVPTTSENSMEVLLCERINDQRHSLFHHLNCFKTTASELRE